MLAYYTEVIGYTLEERGADGAAYLSNALDHHTMNFLKSKCQKMHHIAFQLRDWAQVQHACDHLARHHIPLL
jgi:catechol-2,3-dioxygenase